MFKRICSLLLIMATLLTLFTGWTVAEAAIVNLFDTATMINGYYNGSGNRNGDGQYRSSAPIAVSKGDVITFGTAVTNQGFHLVTMQDESTYTGQYANGNGISVLHTIDSSTSILSFTVPADVVYIRLVAATTNANHYLVTKNRPFTVDELNGYFNADYTNLFDVAAATPGWVNGQGTTSTDNQYRVSPPIAVTAGDSIYLAGAFTKQGFHLVTMSSQTTYVEQYTLGSGLTKTEDLDDNTCIMSFTVPSGITHIRVIAYTTYSNIYLATKNHPVTKVGYNQYFFSDKTALFVGDSISYGAGDGGRAWAARMSASLGFTADNQSVNGWALSASRMTRIVNEFKEVKGNTYDYVIMEGGTNDAWDKSRIGTVADSYDPKDFDISTFAGGLEELFYNAYQNFPGARFGFIITFKMPLATDKGYVAQMEPYANMSIEICKKWNVPYLDLYHDDYVNNTLLEVNTTTYLTDTVHPNAAAYDRLSPYIEQWFKTLSVNDISSFATKMPALADRTAKMPYKVGNTLYVNDCDAIYSWVPSANSSLLLNTANKTQGEGSLSLYGYDPANNSTGAGSMAFLYLPQSADLSGYDTILYDVYLSKDMTGKAGFLQLNFATQTQDGYNTAVGLSDKTAGWHSVALSANNAGSVVQDAFDWADINLLRFTWFYRDSGVTDLTILMDNIRLYKKVDATIINPVITQIGGIGEVTADNYTDQLSAIEGAEKAVAELITAYGPDITTQITNHTTLTAARDAYDALAQQAPEQPDVPDQPDDPDEPVVSPSDTPDKPVVSPSDTPDEPIITPSDVTPGDVNGDGKVNAVDALWVLQAAVGKRTLTADQIKIGDMDKNSKLDAVDALAILKKAVGK